jgi:hypothetical protein
MSRPNYYRVFATTLLDWHSRWNVAGWITRQCLTSSGESWEPTMQPSEKNDAEALKPSFADFDLRGKDWLTEAEAAHYCGVSLRQFQDHARAFNARRFMGKKLYSRAELFDAVQAAPLWYAPLKPYVPQPSLSGHVDPKIMARLSNDRIRPYKPRKKRGDP